MNETAPPQKQDIDRLRSLLEAILNQLAQINAKTPKLKLSEGSDGRA